MKNKPPVILEFNKVTKEYRVSVLEYEDRPGGGSYYRAILTTPDETKAEETFSSVKDGLAAASAWKVIKK